MTPTELDELTALAEAAGEIEGSSAYDILAAKPTTNVEEESGFLGNAFAGAGERLGELGGQLAQTGVDVRDWLNSNLGEVVVGTEGIDYYSPEEIASGKMEGKTISPLEGMAESGKEADFGYTPDYTVDKLLDSEGVWDTIKNTAGLIVEQGIVSAPDMVALITTAPAYALSRTTELSYERAKNNGRDKPNEEDRMWGSATALASLAVDKFGLSKIQEKGLADDFFKALGKKAGYEAGTEAIQESGEYAGTTIGTEVGFDVKDMGKVALGGALGGAGLGAAFGIPSALKGVEDVDNVNKDIIEGKTEDVPVAEEVTIPDVTSEPTGEFGAKGRPEDFGVKFNDGVYYDEAGEVIGTNKDKLNIDNTGLSPEDQMENEVTVDDEFELPELDQRLEELQTDFYYDDVDAKMNVKDAYIGLSKRINKATKLMECLNA